ncbi:MAG: OmpA family protein [Myxococcota bacterium]
MSCSITLPAVLAAQTQIKSIHIEGHTDNRGSASRNKSLSQSVPMPFCIISSRRGIDPGRLQAVGYGEDKPVASNNTRRGRDTNRRVEFVLADCKEETKVIEVE